MSLQTVNETQYREVMKAKGVVVAEFGAAWCAPCKNLLPILDQLAVEYGSSVGIVKVDVDHSPELAGAYGIMSMPTVIIFKDGQPVEKLVGLRPKDAYKAVIDRTVGAV